MRNPSKPSILVTFPPFKRTKRTPLTQPTCPQEVTQSAGTTPHEAEVTSSNIFVRTQEKAQVTSALSPQTQKRLIKLNFLITPYKIIISTIFCFCFFKQIRIGYKESKNRKRVGLPNNKAKTAIQCKKYKQIGNRPKNGPVLWILVNKLRNSTNKVVF
jgi:hypothetical protein